MSSLLSSWLRRRQYLLILLISTIVACSTALPSQSQSFSKTARPANSFIHSVGVVVHLNRVNSAYNNYDSIIKPRLRELGVHHIREGG